MKRLTPVALAILAGFSVGLASFDTSTAQAAQKALVLGNSDYGADASIPTASGDVDSITRALELLGFEVITGKNLSNGELRAVISDFGDDVTAGDAVVFYYAGHVVTWNERSYLLPVGSTIRGPFDLPTQTIPLSTLLSHLESAPVRVAMGLLDTGYGNSTIESAGLTMLPHIDELPDNTVVVLPVDRGGPRRSSAGATSALARAYIAELGQGDMLLPQLATRTIERLGDTEASGASFEVESTLPGNEARSLLDPEPLTEKEPKVEIAEPGTDVPTPHTAVSPTPEEPSETERLLQANALNVAEKRAIQAALAERGYGVGVVDGIFGPRTEQAIRRFQESLGDDATGTLTAGQRDRLIDEQ